MSTALLARSAKSDRAFERLYRRHVHEVYRYVLAVLRNQADAEDATQATFLSAYRAFAGGEEPLKPRNWLLKIAHNECRQRFRAASRRPKEVEWDERVAAPGVDETVPTADEIRTALAYLSFNQRSALVMRELEGRSYAEIGGILGVSVSAVETVLFRARRALREQLEGALTCGEAEITLSKRLDGRVALAEQRALRAHLRECAECATLERKQRARRAAVKRLGIVQLPPSLAGFLGGSGSLTGGAIVGSGFVAKAAAVVAAGVVAGGVGQKAVDAVAAAPARTPLPELRHPRQLQPTFRVGQSPVAASAATAAQTGTELTAPPGAPQARRVRDRVRSALKPVKTDTGSGAAPAESPDEAATVSSTQDAAQPVSAIPVQAPSPPAPVDRAVGSAEEVVRQLPVNQTPNAPLPVPVPPAPPAPVEVPPVTVPTLPTVTVPTLPPPPPPPPLP